MNALIEAKGLSIVDKAEISVDPMWIAQARTYQEEAEAVSVASQAEFEGGSELLRKITKHSNALEKARKSTTQPLTRMAKEIKAVADRQLSPLQASKEALSRRLNVYAGEQARRAAEERARIEEEQRKEAEKQLAEQAISEDLGLDLEQSVTVTEAQPTVMEARSADVAVRHVLKWEVTNEGQIPPRFFSFDERKLNAYLRDHDTKRAIMEQLAKDPTNQPIPGIKMTVEKQTVSR